MTSNRKRRRGFVGRTRDDELHDCNQTVSVSACCRLPTLARACSVSQRCSVEQQWRRGELVTADCKYACSSSVVVLVVVVVVKKQSKGGVDWAKGGVATAVTQ
jgi:hypothetical protein